MSAKVIMREAIRKPLCDTFEETLSSYGSFCSGCISACQPDELRAAAEAVVEGATLLARRHCEREERIFQPKQ